jgi:membrane protein
MRPARATRLSLAAVRLAATWSAFGWISRRSAALAYYGALSLAPLVVVALSVASLLWDRESLRRGMIEEFAKLVGPTGADLIDDILRHSARGGAGPLAATLGLGMLLLGATAVFMELQDGLNSIWEVEARPERGLWRFVRTRLVSLAMAVSTGFLLLVSLVVSALLSALTKALGVTGTAAIVIAAEFIVDVAATSFLFAALFRFLPDARIRWREVAAGAIITGVLFNVGEAAIGAYLGRTSVGSTYWAAGSLVIVLVWVYYSSALMYFGARVTRAWCLVSGCGVHPRPKPGAVEAPPGGPDGHEIPAR